MKAAIFILFVLFPSLILAQSSTVVQRSANAAAQIPGWPSETQIQSVLAASREANNAAFITLTGRIEPVSKELLSLQRQALSIVNFAHKPCILAIADLQSQLGKSLVPKDDYEVGQLIILYQKCVPFFYDRLPSSASVKTFLQLLDVEQKQQADIRSAKDLIAEIWAKLVVGEFGPAKQLFDNLTAHSATVRPPFAQAFIRETATLQADLTAYVAAGQLEPRPDAALTTTMDAIQREDVLLTESTSTPLTAALLQKNIAADKKTLKARIDALPAFHFDSSSYQLPSLKVTTPGGAPERAASLAEQLTRLNASVDSASDLNSLLVNPSSLSAIDAWFGSSVVADINQKGAPLSLARQAKESLSAELIREQQIIATEQQRIETEQQRVAALQEKIEEKARVKRALAAEAAQRETAMLAARQAEVQERKDRIRAQTPALDMYASELRLIRGKRFSSNRLLGLEILNHITNQIPLQQKVNIVSMYTLMEGLDGSATLEALARLRSLYVGKYYMLPGDVFQIQANRDYPREGLNEFSAFGQVKLLANYYIPINVYCISTEKVPPYSLAPIFGRIINFSLSESRSGKTIIVPTLQVVAVVGLSANEIIINQ
jgi:hypothetical protein